MEALTKRQNEIVRLRCERGLTIEESAYELCLSRQTVKNHCTAILKRYGFGGFFQICTLYGRATALNPVIAMRPEAV